MRQLAKIDDPDQLTQGLFPSLAPNQLALWRDGENVRFEEGRASKSKGWITEPTSIIPGAPDYDIVALAQSFVEGNRRVFYGTTNGYNSLNLYDDGAWRTLGSGYNSGLWSLETFGTWLLATNNSNPPQVWKAGAANATALGGLNFSRCKILRKNSNHLVGFNFDTGGQRIQWSAASNVELWTPDLDNNDAGGLDIRDLDADISAAEPLGAGLAFYSEDSMGTTSYVGGSFVFSNKVVLNGIGAVGINAVVAFGNFNYGLGRKGFWRTDGFQFEYIHSPAVKLWLEANIDWSGAYTAAGFHNERKTSIEWFFPCLDGQTRGLAYNYLRSSWTKLHFPVTAVIEEQVFSYPIVALGNAFAFYGNGVDADTAALPAGLTSAIFDCGFTDRYKFWECVVLEATWTGGVQIRFGFAETPTDAALAWTDWQQLARENWVPAGGREAPFASFQIQSLGEVFDFSISGISILGEVGGFI